ncbi:zf-HC2 domain-containing protein [Streptomyces sp. NPDC048629]|uniref:zf-HC2 domain-containing protein n=1 Tax=Streptomyces sp. NPDC048629 TaxID=3154824 RepID=UPI00342235F4
MEIRRSVGAYVLGALEPAEAAELDVHLAGCPECLREAEELAEVEALLSDFAATAPDAEDVFSGGSTNSVRTRMSDRSGRRLRRSLALAASVALFAGGLTLGGAFRDDAPSSQNPNWATQLIMTGEVRQATDPTTRVNAKVGMEKKKWGTHVALELRGVKGPINCDLVAVSRSGERRTVTSWLVPEGGYGVPGKPDPLVIHGAAAMARDDIDHFEVVTGDGKKLVGIPA